MYHMYILYNILYTTYVLEQHNTLHESDKTSRRREQKRETVGGSQSENGTRYRVLYFYNYKYLSQSTRYDIII